MTMPAVLRALKKRKVVPAIVVPASYRLNASRGTFLLTGGNASLIKTTVGAYTMTATPRSYATNGASANLKQGLRLTATPRSYALAGGASAFLRTKSLSAAGRTYTVNGGVAAFKRALRMTAAKGTFLLSGGAASFNLASPGAAPTLSLVSAAGASPVNWKVAGSTSIGMYAEFEVVYGALNASDAIFNAGSGGIGSNGVTNFQTYLAFMQGEDWELASNELELFVEPAGAYTVRARYRTNPYDPATSTDTVWSNKIYDTVTASTATFAHINATDWKSANLTLSNGFKTMQGQAQNSAQGARATIAGADKGTVEFTLTDLVSGSTVYMGFENGTTDFSVFQARPGNSNSAGVCVEATLGGTTLAVFWNGTAGSSFPTVPALADGDKIRLTPNRTTNALKIQHIRGATVTAVGTPTVAGLSGFTRFWGAVKNTDILTVEPGPSALDSGDVIYG